MYFSINRTICVDTAVEKKNKLFRQIALKYMRLKKHRCELCSFQEPTLQQVITKNGKYTEKDYEINNLMVVCPHCYYGCRLGYAAINDAIDIVYAPTVSQAALNHFNRLLTFYTDNEPGSYVEKLKEGFSEAELDLASSISHSATSILIELDATKEEAKKVYKGFDPSNLVQLVSFLHECSDEEYEKRGKFFESFRYMVKPQIARQLNKTYSNSIFKPFSPEQVQDKASTFITMADDVGM